MSIYKQFETDKECEQKGVWLPVGVNEDGSKAMIRIARAGGSNQKYQKVLEVRTKPYRRMIQNDILEVKVADEVMVEVFADAVVLAWEGILDREGKPIPFSRENVVKLFKELPDLFNDVREQSTKSALFRKDVLEAEGKNF
jgi:hypothetical protein